MRYNCTMADAMGGRRVRVFLLDDHDEVRGGSGDLLAGESGAGVLAPSAAEATSRLPAPRPDVTPREVRPVDPCVKALILTSHEDDRALFAALLAGAAGYLREHDPALMNRVLDRLRERPAERSELASLTEQERRVLVLVAEGLTNRQIGERMCLTEKTVKNYVSSMLAKLGLERRTQAAVLASRLLD
jgi:two-component system, NarL family, response regulator DevR